MKISSAVMTAIFGVACVAIYSCFFTPIAGAQDFSGTRTSDYSGINGVFSNPARIAGSPYRFDINLLSVSSSAGNDKVAHSLSDFSNVFNEDSIKKVIFGGRNEGPGDGMANLDIHLPSFMFNVSAKTAFALTTRIRYMTNVADLDGKLYQKISQKTGDNTDLPYEISSARNMRATVNAWSEVGVSMAHTILVKDGNLLKVGITVKYLMGASGSHIGVNGFKGRLTTSEDIRDKRNVYLENASGQINVGSGGIDLDDIQADQLQKESGRGIGGDIGFVYQYRGPAGSYDSVTHGQYNMIPYKIQASLSLLDIGSLTYHAHSQNGNYDMNITDDEKMAVGNFNNRPLIKYKSYFDDHPEYFSAGQGNVADNYKMPLPTSLLASVDYRVHKRFCLNLESRIVLSGDNRNSVNSYYYSSVCFTPRYEGRGFGAYIPMSYNKLTGLDAGFALRCGPLFFGSGGILTACLDKSKLIDFHLGIHISSLHRNPRER